MPLFRTASAVSLFCALAAWSITARAQNTDVIGPDIEVWDTTSNQMIFATNSEMRPKLEPECPGMLYQASVSSNPHLVDAFPVTLTITASDPSRIRRIKLMVPEPWRIKKLSDTAVEWRLKLKDTKVVHNNTANPVRFASVRFATPRDEQPLTFELSLHDPRKKYPHPATWVAVSAEDGAGNMAMETIGLVSSERCR